MGYTKGETYTQTANLTGPVTVADEQYYGNDVYAKILTVNNKLTVTDVVVESGGSMLTNNTTAANAATFTGVTVGNSGYLRIYNCHKTEDVTVLSGGLLLTRHSATLHNADIKSGATWRRLDSTYLGGMQTNIEKGVNYTETKLGDDFFVSNGLICNLDLKYENTSRCYIYDIKVSGAKVSSGTWLRILTGYTTSANETVVYSGGSFYAEAGDSIKISNTVVSNGGTFITGGNYIEGLTVKAGGSVTKLFTGAQKLVGRNFDIETGADIAGYTDVYTDADGAIHNIRVADGAALNLIGAAAVDPKINGTFYNSSGTYVSGLSTIDQSGAGAAIFYKDTVCDDPNFVSGNYLLLNYEGVTLGGANAAVTDTEIRYCSNNSRTAYTTDDRITIQNGAITGMTLVSSGYWLKQITLANGITADAPEVSSGGMLDVCDAVINGATVHANGAMNVSSGAIVSDLVAATGARVDFVRDTLFTGADTNVAASTFYYDGAADALGFSIQDGVVKDLGSDGNAYRIRLGDGLVVSDAVVRDDWRISAFGDATISGAEVFVGGTTSAAVLLKGSNTAYDVTLTGGGIYQAVLNLDGTGASASGTVVNSGGKLGIGAAAGGIENTVVKAGGKLQFSAGAAASTGKLLTLDFTGGSSLEINKLDLIDSTTRVEGKGLAVGGTYTLTAGTATTTLSVCCDSTAVYDNAVRGGTSYTNAFAGKTWNFSTGKTIEVTEFNIGAVKTTAGAITNEDTALNGTDRAAKWDADTVYTASVTLADNSLAGDAWLVIDGTVVSSALYGASGNYGHVINIEAKSGTIRNLAAGAATGGSVAGVKLTLDGADVTGAAYAGGFGNVTDEVKTQIAAGTFAKDFYAGALANKLTSATSVGDVCMTVDSGTFDGNIYGASAVKTDSTKGNGTRHTAGDVTLTVTGGSTTKGAQACIFAGGYATGNATGTVYTVDSVTATISGGDWGEAAGGRGVFGGIFASGVEAQVIGDVNITISGDATMGNVYGGGWAQKGGTSIVGSVNISIEGGTVMNVFGGGSTSATAPGGSTVAEDVTITVKGGTITGDIFARGQGANDSVTGSANVIFTGSDGFDCDVFGYSYVGGAESDAALSFSSYTGEFSGEIGGFDGIKFDDATAMTLDTAANDISNGAWEFDFTERDASLSGSSLLTWSGADFTNDTIKVTFADDTQAQGGWNIATVAEAFSGTTFNVEVGGTEIGGGLAYGGQIATGDYAGWGFELESGVLKFKNLASA